ncbi:MAG: radical SAM protein [Candidatus Omnitrophica bacterium]|nr:radical SAM protein [Candidatus Omnitrophota bacterium]
MMKQKVDDLNFLRFLTVSLPPGIEDPCLSSVLSPLTQEELHGYFSIYNSQKSLFLKQMHLYVYIPFCATICSYCHCERMPLKEASQLSRYVDFVIKQINEFGESFDKTDFESCSVLGGTASLLSGLQIRMIFEAVLKKFRFKKEARFNFEGHPGSLSVDKLKVLQGYGIHTIHLGVQSLDASVLKRINRPQTRAEVGRTIKLIKKMGFPCINVDLVAGLPGQTTQSFLSDIKDLVGWGTDLFNINPFSDVSVVPCFKNIEVTLAQMLDARHEMIHQAKMMLEGYGYGNKGQRGYFKEARDESCKLDAKVYPGGVLGLGLLAKSNLPGTLVFKTLLDADKMTGRYIGFAIDKRYSMAQYAWLHMLYGLDTKAFRKIFGQDFLSVFSQEIRFLLDKGVISKKKEVYSYAGQRTIKRLFNYFAYTQILLGEKMIGKFKQVLRFKYDPCREYGSNADLVKVFQNFEFTREYYQVGKKTLWL